MTGFLIILAAIGVLLVVAQIRRKKVMDELPDEPNYIEPIVEPDNTDSNEKV